MNSNSGWYHYAADNSIISCFKKIAGSDNFSIYSGRKDETVSVTGGASDTSAGTGKAFYSAAT